MFGRRFYGARMFGPRYFGGVGSDIEYPEGVPASRSIRLPAGGVWVLDPDVEEFCEMDFSGSLPTGVTLVSVASTIPSELTEVASVTDTTDGRFAIKVSGIVHGETYSIVLVATLSNAGTITVTAPLRSFNG